MAATPGPMSIRRAHTKSRKGCADCKRRKVKCDETYPSCIHCTRRGIVCSLSASRTPSGVSTTGTDRAASSSEDRGVASSPRLANIDALILRFQSRPSIAETWGHGLELMHHYSTVTADSFASSKDRQHVWRVVVPEIAYDAPFLMHIILATSASHKAYLVPTQKERYHDMAAYHQTAGLEGFRAALADMDSHDWRAIFCCSALVVLAINTHGSGPEGREGGPPAELDCFQFSRGIKSIMTTLEPQIGRTILSPLSIGVWPSDAEVENGFRKVDWVMSTLPNGIAEALDRLESFYRRSFSGPRLEEYINAVNVLRRSAFSMSKAGPLPEASMSMVAAYMTPDKVVAELLVLDPFAMVYLAHFAIYLATMERRFWYMDGLPAKFFQLIDQQLVGLPEHLEMVSWARIQVFEVYGSK